MNKKKSTNPVFLLVLGLGIIVYGLVSDKQSIDEISPKYDIEIKGQITDKEIESRKLSPNRRHRYQPKITYRYIYNSKEYTNDNTTINWFRKDRERSISILAKYRIGDKVNVYVSSDSPEKSIILIEESSADESNDKNNIVLFLGGLLTIFSIFRLVRK